MNNVRGDFIVMLPVCVYRCDKRFVMGAPGGFTRVFLPCQAVITREYRLLSPGLGGGGVVRHARLEQNFVRRVAYLLLLTSQSCQSNDFFYTHLKANKCEIIRMFNFTPLFISQMSNKQCISVPYFTVFFNENF